MPFLYFLEGLRTPFLDQLFSAITSLGGETALLALGLTFFWCVDKKLGYYALTAGLGGTVFNQFLKLACRIPRPWVRDPNFTIVEAARADAGGYSFPSGHTQNSVSIFGALALEGKRRWVRITALVLAVLVPFSRMYLGVHTPQDVLVAAASSLVLLLLFRPLVYSKKSWVLPLTLGVLTALSAAFCLYVELFHFSADLDPANLQEGVKNAYTLLGAFLGFLVVYLVDEAYLHFPTEALWWAQILKLFLGLVLVVAAKILLKAPLLALCGGHSAASAIRYFLLVLLAGLVWPLTFPWFSRLGRKNSGKAH